MEIEGTFVWESGDPLSDEVSAYWKGGSTSAVDEERNCVYIKTDTEKMQVAKCHIPKQFVCQKEPTGGEC